MWNNVLELKDSKTINGYASYPLFGFKVKQLNKFKYVHINRILYFTNH